MKVAAHIRVSGRVQGVGYRYFAVRNAEMLGLTGFVRNCSDGSVELKVEGERDLIEQFGKILKDGPRFSRVNKLDLTFDAYQAKYTNFIVDY